MKWLILAGILFVVVTFLMRRRHEEHSSRKHTSARSSRGSMFARDDDSVNVRSADNVRLISDDQLSAIDSNPRKPVE